MNKALIKITNDLLHAVLNLPDEVEIVYVNSTETDRRRGQFCAYVTGEKLFDVLEGSELPWITPEEVARRYADE